MKVLLICGFFAKENEAEVIRHARAPVEFSANICQRKLMDGLRAIWDDVSVLSAPFVGAYPKASDLVWFTGFQQEQYSCSYVTFFNVWGARNFSRAARLKKAVDAFVRDPAQEKMIVVYCPHTPFIEAAVYAKKKDPKIKICLYVPDLPQYMNLRADRSRLYDMAKALDNRKMYKLMKQVDSYVLLTEQMKTVLPIGDKPFLVREGILDLPLESASEQQIHGDEEKYIVYTGKLDEKFGIPALLEAFSGIEDPKLRLVLCGAGDCMERVYQAAAKDPRILSTGQITPDEAKAWQKKATVLINPRANNEAYVKYSFPSKITEYLLTGKPVVSCLLDGMPREYESFLYVIDEAKPAPEGIRDGIYRALSANPQIHADKVLSYRRYADRHLRSDRIAEDIGKMTM